MKIFKIYYVLGLLKNGGYYMRINNKYNKKISYTTDTACIYESTDDNIPISSKLSRGIANIEDAL